MQTFQQTLAEISPILQKAILGVLILMLLVAVYTDLRTKKIYNWLTLPCMMLGITLNLAVGGPKGLLLSLAGGGLILGLYVAFAPSTGIGGGDVKLMMAVGTLLGIKLVFWAMLFSMVIHGFVLIIELGRRKLLGDTLKNLGFSLILKAKTLGREGGIAARSRGLKCRNSVAIAAGTILALFLDKSSLLFKL